jgi:hypothetical protein
MKLYIHERRDPKVGDIFVRGDSEKIVTAVYETFFQAGGRTYYKQWIAYRYRATGANNVQNCQLAVLSMVYPYYIKQT